MKNKIIGLTGYKGCGKSTVSRTIAEWNLLRQDGLTERLSFAQPIREMLKVGLGLQGDDFSPANKGIVLERFGKSPRQLMQTLGTDWGRRLVTPSIWVELARRRLHNPSGLFKKLFPSTPLIYVFDDVRFDDEAEMILQEGGEIWHIARPEREGDNHVSEKGIMMGLVTRHLANNTTVAELKALVECTLELPDNVLTFPIDDPKP